MVQDVNPLKSLYGYATKANDGTKKTSLNVAAKKLLAQTGEPMTPKDRTMNVDFMR